MKSSLKAGNVAGPPLEFASHRQRRAYEYRHRQMARLLLTMPKDAKIETKVATVVSAEVMGGRTIHIWRDDETEDALVHTEIGATSCGCDRYRGSFEGVSFTKTILPDGLAELAVEQKYNSFYINQNHEDLTLTPKDVVIDLCYAGALFVGRARVALALLPRPFEK